MLLYSNLLPYPLDLVPVSELSFIPLDQAGVPYQPASHDGPDRYDATHIAQYALAHWNAYLKSEDDVHREAVMAQAHWLLAHQVSLSNDAGGWPIHMYSASRLYLSACTQGNGCSVLLRAYQLTHEDDFLQAARRAVRTFELDILDGGVNAPIGTEGLFFEEIAVYPASHTLKGHILALFGLYDYALLTKDSVAEVLIQRGIVALHTLLDAFDTGYWTRYDLLHKRLATSSEHMVHVALLTAVAACFDCKYCTSLVVRWRRYQRRPTTYMQYLLIHSMRDVWDKSVTILLRHLGLPNRHTPLHNDIPRNRICVPITAFPVPGGMRSVLKSVAQVMENHWQMLYLTHHKGQGAEELAIELFGRRIASPWQFPGVWLYCLSGGAKLLHLLGSGSAYELILPQDGVFTSAFAALIGKMAGIRVVCMDHGSVTLLNNRSFQRECLETLVCYSWPQRALFSLLFRLYWPSQYVMARIATPCIDQFLVAGDEVEEVYRTLLHVHPGRISRYAYMIDVTRFTPPDKDTWLQGRMAQGLAEDAIVITLINRLAVEKGLHFALEGIALALSSLPLQVRERVKVLIVGDGALRSQVKADIQKHHLRSQCILWGEAKPHDVIMLLGISDIFLYSGTRGTNYSVAVLEAMAAGCAVVASVMPQSNAQLLAEGRGIAVTPASATEIGAAITRLCNDIALCHTMGQMAREYVAVYHSPLALQRSLLRVSFFTPLLDDVRRTSARHTLSSG